MTVRRTAGDALVAAAIAFGMVLVGLVVAPTSTSALTARDVPTTAEAGNVPTAVTPGFAQTPRIVPGVGVIPRTSF